MGQALTLLQVEAEIDGFAQILKREGVRSYLEIGSKFGESLARVAKTLPVGSRVVSVDLPKGTKAWPESERALKGNIAKLQADGYDAHLIWGDSTHRAVIDQVAALGPYDAIFIDANHTLPFLENDWANYGRMGRIVAFHDINWHRAPEWVGVRIDVPEFWDRIKADYRHEEFRLCPTGKNNGIGVLWR